MAGRVNFDSLLAMHQEAMRVGHGSKPWIEFAIKMADIFPSLYKTAQKMNAEAVELVAQRDELLAALVEAEVIITKRLGYMHLYAQSARLAIATAKGVSEVAVIEDKNSVECDSCPNVTAGCLGKCMKAEVQ